jgi:hypothetical protein
VSITKFLAIRNDTLRQAGGRLRAGICEFSGSRKSRAKGRTLLFRLVVGVSVRMWMGVDKASVRVTMGVDEIRL